MPAERIDDNQTADSLLIYNEGLAHLLGAFANETRLRILSTLLRRRQEFADLQGCVGISKTALAKHLNVLVSAGAIQRVGRGTYQITNDAADSLRSICQTYLWSRERRLSDAVRRVKLYSLASKEERQEMKKYEVKKKAEILPTWISYVGATTGVLNSLGIDVDRADVAGYTGYAFVVNVSKEGTCPSGPTAHDAFFEFPRGFEALGWKVDFSHKQVEGCGFEAGKVLTDGQKELALDHYKEVSKNLRLTERPVVIWGAPIPEFSIVNGVDDGKYIVSSFRSHVGQPDDPLNYDQLQAPGGVMLISFKEQVKKPDVAKADFEALDRAIDIAKGKYVEDFGYVMGPNAFEVWAKNLTTKDALYGGNAYVGVCTQEAFAWAEMFLSRMAKRYKGKAQSKFLDAAAKSFDKAQKIMDDFTKLFPFSWEREFQNGDRESGAKMLLETRHYFEQAISNMEKAHTEWD